MFCKHFSPKKIGFSFSLVLAIPIIFQSCKKGVDVNIESLKQLAVWNEAQHNAFTDLIHFNNNYYCVFREASDHNSFDGKTRIIKSANGINWINFSLLSIPNRDFRDAHFFVDDNSVLSISINARDKYNTRQNVIFKLRDTTFVQVKNVNVDNDYLLWGFSKLKDSVYSVGYNVKQICFNAFNSDKPKLKLFNNKDTECINFGDVNVGGSWIAKTFDCPCESSMVFTPDSTLIVIVRDEHTPRQSHFGVSKYPFNNWNWTVFPYFVRGPKLALLPNGKLFLAAGSMAYYNETYYAIVNQNNFQVEKLRVFPSDGDSGYPGVIIEGNTALVSYYSSHEGNARIYIDRIEY
jgi:hypothetical protein